ncbi:MAG: sigma-70 family RNA polymerase sigma factor [Thiohalophilus sp.]|uniref:RNA polymerase sigma factor n=1 Tax=Thiohalophilus sp. TaxID=3028392 RepID=UPI0028705D5E|nr:sigma-70 family RNA polymerase sigma factor [Thiohalophilus sp.]MDR9435901.1 sigma-70 family RNA polymerase sigma factor [Thiohalophilus sp.]
MNPLNLFSRHHHIKERLEELRPQLYRLAYSWTNNPALADDLTQETLAKALKNVAQLKKPEALKSWSFGILRNCWRDHYRSSRDMDDVDNEVLADNQTPEKHHEQQNIVDKVRGAVAKLPEGQRHVLTLIDLEGCSYAEVAEILEIPIGTVMSRLCRARKSLAGKLLEFQPESADNVASIRRVV